MFCLSMYREELILKQRCRCLLRLLFVALFFYSKHIGWFFFCSASGGSRVLHSADPKRKKSSSPMFAFHSGADVLYFLLSDLLETFVLIDKSDWSL